jgi:hypothetical protein
MLRGQCILPLIPANRTGHVTRTMDLHVHIQRVLVAEKTGAFTAPIGRVATVVNAILTARCSIAFEPLIAAETVVRAPVAAFGAVPPHC